MRILHHLATTVGCAAMALASSALAQAAAPVKQVRMLSAPKHAIGAAVLPSAAAQAALRLQRPTPLAATASTAGFYVDSQFMGLSLVDTINIGAGFIPPDMGGAASGKYVFQIINGGVAIYDRQGNLLAKPKLDSTFWLQAGVPKSIVNAGVSDPRVTWDPASQRWFVTEINVNVPNTIMVAVSKTSNPLDGFRAVYTTLNNNSLGDYPTVGVNADALTVSTNNFLDFQFFTSVAVLSYPKADLLLAKPSAANLARFDSLDPNVYGFSLQAVDSQNPSDGTQPLLAVSNTTLNRLELAQITDPGEPTAGVSSPRTLFTKYDGSPLLGRQPGGTGYDNGDDRIEAKIKQVGNYVYFTNTAADPAGSVRSSNYVHWGILDRTTGKIVAEGTVRDPAKKIDYSYPAIDANANGRFVIGYNGSSATKNISAYATICDFNQATKAVACTAPQLIAYGIDGDYNLGAPGSVRWGDYSALQIDPINPQAFWLFQEIPGPRNVNAGNGPTSEWETVVTHIVTQ